MTGAVSARAGEQVLEVDARGGGCAACEGASGRQRRPQQRLGWRISCRVCLNTIKGKGETPWLSGRPEKALGTTCGRLKKLEVP